jgi:hypothetical protein
VRNDAKMLTNSANTWSWIGKPTASGEPAVWTGTPMLVLMLE